MTEENGKQGGCGCGGCGCGGGGKRRRQEQKDAKDLGLRAK